MRSSQALGRSVFPVVAFLALASSAPAQQILEVYADSLTTYLPGATAVNGVRPLVSQRGVNIDGSWRSSPGLAMQLAGNPSENAWIGKQTDGPMRIDVGAYEATEIDLALPTTGLQFSFGRTFNSLQVNSGGSSISSDGVCGINWASTAMPEIVLYTHPSDSTKDVVYLVYGADRFVEFKRTTDGGSNQFKGKNGAAGAFDYAANGAAADTYTLTDQVGNRFVFFGFDGASGVAAGQLWKMIDPAGTVAYVGDPTTSSTAITNGYDSTSGGIKLAYDGSDHRYSLAYSTLSGVRRLTQIKAEVKDSGSWGGSPVNVRTAVQVDYDYYGTSDANGDAGNLRKVTVTTLLNDDEAVTQVKKKYYRYYTGTYDATGTPKANPGHPNTLKLVVDYEGCRRFDLLDSTFDEDFLTASTDDLKPYSSAYFEYDSSKRINLALFQGQCGCGSSGASGTHEYTYATNGSYTDNSGYDTTWAKRTIVERPDGSYLTQVFDETSQGLTRVISDGDPSSATDLWVTQVVRDSAGFVTEIDTPESISGYTHSTNSVTVTSYSSSSPLPGLIWKYVRTGSSTLTGFLEDRKFQRGSGATSVYYDASQTWTTTSATVGYVTIYRPLVATSVRYPTQSTSTSGSLTTTYSYTDYSYDSQPLAIRKVTTTQPAVTTGNNGPNSSLLSYAHLTREGKVDFEKKTDATVSYYEFEDGNAKTIKEDADTGSLTLPVPSSGSGTDSDFASSGTPLDKTTTKTFSKLGFQKQSAPPTGTTSPVLRTKLADERLVTIEYPDYGGSPTVYYYGPARFTVYNQAGKVEVTGTIAYSTDRTTTSQASQINETKSDPLEAVATGTVAQMTVNIYDDSGTEVIEERRYFSMPGSGAGTEGTHYDATRYGYDSMGRRVRTKEASGTIRRTAFDIRGQVSDSYIGTNDHAFAGGEVSGSDNMVKTEHLVYDGGADELGQPQRHRRQCDGALRVHERPPHEARGGCPEPRHGPGNRVHVRHDEGRVGG